MIDTISEDRIPLMIDESKKELNMQGRQALKAIIDKYQDVKNINKIAAVQSEVDSVKSDLQKTVAKQMENMEDVRELQNKSNTLMVNAQDYRSNARTLRRLTWCQNFKLWIIIIIVVIILVLVIVLPIVC